MREHVLHDLLKLCGHVGIVCRLGRAVLCGEQVGLEPPTEFDRDGRELGERCSALDAAVRGVSVQVPVDDGGPVPCHLAEVSVEILHSVGHSL